MSARSKDAVAALHEAAQLCEQLADECRVRPGKELLSGDDLAAIATLCAEMGRALAAVPDPMAEAREIVEGMEENGTMVPLRYADWLRLARALRMEVDGE